MSTTKKRKVLWLTWEKQIRNRSMSKALNVPLWEIYSDRSRMIRYAICISKTTSLLLRERPSVVICQNPSMILTALILLLKRLFRFRVAIDAHFGGIEAYRGNETIQRVLDHCNCRADIVIVTTEGHAKNVQKIGGRAFVCQDPLPDLRKYGGPEAEIWRKVFFISSFDIDEPYQELFRAAEILAPEGFRFFTSGNYRKAGIVPGEFPGVEFLGYLPEQDFYRHLFSSQVIVDLTEYDNCLVCGAYEALQAGKPLVLSKKKALQDYFTGGVIFTENRAAEIAAAVRKAHCERSRLADESRQWASQAQAEMAVKMATLKQQLESL